MDYSIRELDISKLRLDLDNPRHRHSNDQKEAIEILCKDDQVLNLAKDIAKEGLNPLDLFAVIKVPETKDIFEVLEGNRRVCALKILHDPNLAPSNIKKQLEDISKKPIKIDKVRCIEFPDRNSAKIWLERIHAGQQNGIGRKTWNSDQKARFLESIGREHSNTFALAFLDFCEEAQIIDAESRKKRLTTAQRYFANPTFRETFGLTEKDTEVTTNVPLEDFLILAKIFIKKMIDGEANSRAKVKENIIPCAMELRLLPELSNKKLSTPIALKNLLKPSPITGPSSSSEPDAAPDPGSSSEPDAAPDPGSSSEPDAAPDPGSSSKPDAAPDPGSSSEPDAAPDPGSSSEPDAAPDPGSSSKPDTAPDFTPESSDKEHKGCSNNDEKKIDLESDVNDDGEKKIKIDTSHIQESARVIKLLNSLQIEKLQSLYRSLCTISLQKNTPIISVGLWSFLEVLASNDGASENTDFLSFFSRTRLTSYGISERQKYNAIHQALERISKYGNMTKHHEVSGCFDKDQLRNDAAVVTPLIECVLDSILQKKEENS